MWATFGTNLQRLGLERFHCSCFEGRITRGIYLKSQVFKYNLMVDETPMFYIVLKSFRLFLSF